MVLDSNAGREAREEFERPTVTVSHEIEFTVDMEQ